MIEKYQTEKKIHLILIYDFCMIEKYQNCQNAFITFLWFL